MFDESVGHDEGSDEIKFLSTDELLGESMEMAESDELHSVTLPVLEESVVRWVRQGQTGELSMLLKGWLERGGGPDKNDSLNLSAQALAMLKMFSLFKLNV